MEYKSEIYSIILGLVESLFAPVVSELHFDVHLNSPQLPVLPLLVQCWPDHPGKHIGQLCVS